jgi:hypothetical protein
MKLFSIFLMIGILLNCGSGQFLTKSDYTTSRSHYEKGSIVSALSTYPDGERDSFITIMERTYLNLLAGNPDVNELFEFSKKIEDRLRFSASRELKSFFYLETPEGYYASEHEVIWMHLLLSWGFSLQGEYAKGCTEARISANLLSGEWSPEGRFDDPTMRVILGGLWAMCGNWDDARTDFKAAYNLNKSLRYALDLSNLQEPPTEIILLFGGPGPEPEWNPSFEVNPLRGFRNVRFNLRGQKSSLIVKDKNQYAISLFITPDSSKWYERHEKRDNEIHELVDDSIYGEKVFASAVKSTAVVTGGILLGTGIIIGGTAVGVGIAYIGAAFLSGDGTVAFVIGGGAIIYWSFHKGFEVMGDSVNYSVEDAKKNLDISGDYRYVRYLPEYAWIGWTNQKTESPIKVLNKGKEVPISISEKEKETEATKVKIGYYPDMP